MHSYFALVGSTNHVADPDGFSHPEVSMGSLRSKLQSLPPHLGTTG